MSDPLSRFLAGALDFLQWLVSLPRQGYTNFMRNSVEMWDGMTPLKYIRLIAILGGYLFLRPYLQKWGERTQAKQHEKVLAGDEAVLGANELRDGGKGKRKGKGSGKSVKFQGAEEDEGGEDKGDWGNKARKRQRDVEKKIIEREEERLVDEGDIDIMEHLVDYEEGKDGW
ncbi:hypothetical protein QTJ16_001854 [Diplocarpon rosae]|uniref:Uncharacterized protein n=1 Tax=Diplocarpon rosae TaxID=946125 RepID=A0AAD9T3W5_9HELO|nr:hypothetical protein QTJ16_001854 [Diplocarpon rosae]